MGASVAKRTANTKEAHRSEHDILFGVSVYGAVARVHVLKDMDNLFRPLLGVGVVAAASLRYQEDRVLVPHLLGHRQLSDVLREILQVVLGLAVEADGAAGINP